MQQGPFEILALALPCGQGNFPDVGRPERVLNEFFQATTCNASFGFAWQRNSTSRKLTPFREHFSHDENSGIRAPQQRQETQIPQWITLDRNDLGGFSYGRVNKQSTRPGRLGVIPSWLLSSCLIVCSSRSARTPVRPGQTTEVSRK
jgi:hypothetical protein